jgi:DnaJ-class molecular chaperone
MPKEIANIEVDETLSEKICEKCKGWGYIDEERKKVDALEVYPIRICPKCRGRGILDWIERITITS